MVDDAQDIREGPGMDRIGRECALEEEAVEAVDSRENEEKVRFDMGTEVGRNGGGPEGSGGAVVGSKGSFREASEPLLR